METKIQAIEHSDIRGKKLKYLKISKGEQEVIINIGDKTYESVSKLLDEKIIKEIKK